MKPDTETVRIWIGWQPLIFEFMKKILIENEIEYFESESTGLFLAGGRLEKSLWVKEGDVEKALALLERADEEIADAINREEGDVADGATPP